MTQEQKAKAYDEALKVIKECIPDENGFITIYPQEIFPELKESDDERIRKELLEFLDGLSKLGKNTNFDRWSKSDCVDWICWLEKQGGQKEYTFKPLPRLFDMIEPSDKAKSYCQKLIDSLLQEGYVTDAKIVSNCLKQMNGEKVAMAIMDEKQGEIDNYPLEWSTNTVMTDSKKNQVKLKFKVGDKINKNDRADEEYNILTITSINIEEHCYLCNQGSVINFDEQDMWHVVIQSKFKVGDWVFIEEVDGYKQGPFQIKEIAQHGYTFDERGVIPFECESLMTPWNIQDAKDGDVLVGSKEDVILMFRGIGNTEWDDVIDYHCYYDYHRKDFIVQRDLGYWGSIENNQLKPATKEQRDLLFQKMKKAGYEWDAEKKELKKIHVIDEGKSEINYCFTKMMNGEKINPAWSEEDERILDSIIEDVMPCGECPDYPTDEEREYFYEGNKKVDWLKSLRPRNRWKPSDEQIKAIKLARSFVTDDFDDNPTLSETLIGLEKDLKKLKGE